MSEPLRIRHVPPTTDTGIYVRAVEPSGKWRAADISELEPESLAAWLDGTPGRSRAVVLWLMDERDTARAEADALRAEVARLQANPKPAPLLALLTFLDDNDAEIEITRTAGDDDDDPATWMISYTICGSGSWAEGALDAAARKLCDRLGVDHG